jgi:cyclic beta-1,2-glucan synthetase
MVLSNGAYEVMVTLAGGGYSAFQPPGQGLDGSLAITRWRPDLTSDDEGTFFYIRDTAGGQVWSTGYQPTAREPEQCEVVFGIDRAHFSRRDLGIATRPRAGGHQPG